MTKQELKRNWLIYQSGIKNGELVSINSLGIAVEKSQNLGLANTNIKSGTNKQRLAIVARLLEQWNISNINSAMKGKEMSDEEKVFELCIRITHLMVYDTVKIKDFEPPISP